MGMLLSSIAEEGLSLIRLLIGPFQTNTLRERKWEKEGEGEREREGGERGKGRGRKEGWERWTQCTVPTQVTSVYHNVLWSGIYSL